MKEEVVTYDQAVKLYGLDFDEVSQMAYYHHAWMDKPKLANSQIAFKKSREYDGTDVYFAPSLHMAQMWLREVKGFHPDCVPTPNPKCRWLARVTEFLPDGNIMWKDLKQFETYDAALSAAITEAIELVEFSSSKILINSNENNHGRR